MSNEHSWFREKLPWHLNHLLSDEEAGRLEAHAGSCVPCARLLELSQAAFRTMGIEAGHLTLSQLEVWRSDSGEEADPKRDAVARHLAECEVCREEVTSLAGAPAMSLSDEPRQLSPRQEPMRLERARWISWRSLLAGASAGALATAAAFLLMLGLPARQMQMPSSESPSGSLRPGFSRQPAPVGVTPAVQRPVFDVSSEMRGVPTDTLVVILRHVPVAGFALRPPDLLLDDGQRLRVEWRAPDGEVLLARLLSNSVLRGGGFVVDGPRLTPGVYELRVTRFHAGAMSGAPRSYAIRLTD